MTRELWRMGVYNAVLEGNFFLVVQWGLEKTPYPWRLVDLVEVQDISQ